MKIAVDHTKCGTLGICESIAPDIFEVDDSGTLLLKAATVPEGRISDVEEAVAGCPTEALRLED